MAAQAGEGWCRVTRRVLKWTVPIDDHDHPIGSGPVVLVGSQNESWDVVQVWTDEADDPEIRSARVYGTGQPVPADDKHLGSVIVAPLVWHVFASDRTPRPPHLAESGES